MLQEWILAARRLRQSPGFTTIALLTLALAIGTTTTVFTVVQHVLLQPLAYRDSEQLVALSERVKSLQQSFPVIGPNPRHVFLWQQNGASRSVFASIAIFRHGATGLTVRSSRHPRIAGVLIGSANLLGTLGIHPVLGRDLETGDTIKGHDGVALISHQLWHAEWKERSDVLGQTIRLSERPLTIIGVLPPHLDAAHLGRGSTKNYVADSEVLVPAAMDPLQDFGLDSDYGNWNAIARLQPNVTIAQAQAHLDAAQRTIARLIAAEGGSKDSDALLSEVQPLQEVVTGNVKRPLWFLLAAVTGLLLIAVVNITNAQLSRSLSEEREVAIRSALGASHWQLLRGPLLESLLLAWGGGMGGIWFANATVGALQRMVTQASLPRLLEIQVDTPVLLFSSLLTLSATLLAGSGPALKRLFTDERAALQQQQSSRTVDTRRLSRYAGSFLIYLQIFAGTALLLVTGLLIDSLWHILHTDKGWTPGHVVAAQVELQTAAYQGEKARTQFIDSVLQTIRTLPGAQSATSLSVMPLEGEAWLDELNVPGRTANTGQLANWRRIGPDYFDTLGQKLVHGRAIEDRDRNRDSIVLSEGAAHAVFGLEPALGKQIQNDRLYTVIGIARDARSTSLKDAPPLTVYVHYKDRPPLDPSFLVRSSLPPSQVAAQLRGAIWKQDKNVTIARVKTLADQVNDSVTPERLQTVVLSGFAGAALLLAMLGIYGVLSFSVGTRTQEIGLRVALGARRSHIYGLALQEGTWPVLAGLATGWLASLAAGQLLRSSLYGVKVYDPLVTAFVLTLFLLAAAVASFIPAKRALSIEPLVALRNE